MTYDSTRGVTVLFGGSVDGAVYLNDTWEWDGTAWTQWTQTEGGQTLQCATSTQWPTIRLAGRRFSSADGPTTDTSSNTRLVSAALTNRAADLLHFDFGATGDTFSTAIVQQVALVESVGGTGYLTPSREPVGSRSPGAAIAAWESSSGGSWRILASNTADSTAPAAVSYSTASSWEISRYLYARRRLSISRSSPFNRPDRVQRPAR